TIDTETIIESKAKRKEETEHRYLQMLIKRMAESRGYKAIIEELTPDGAGRVDVHLERNNKKIACEVCVTTPKEWELQNIKKCLAAGYDIVVSIANDKKVLDNIKRQVEATIAKNLHRRILLYEPESFFAYLDEATAKEASTETRMKGYRVKVDYDVTNENERKNKEEQILRAISKSFRKKK
ncbi:MAG TPA: hypothetical protein VD908_17820, partial [Cytophagales bacterium]|nr:hypothetical protein [Cytophagales bacterium]